VRFVGEVFGEFGVVSECVAYGLEAVGVVEEAGGGSGVEGYNLLNVFGEGNVFGIFELGVGCGEEVGVVGEYEDGGYRVMMVGWLRCYCLVRRMIVYVLFD